MPRPVARTLLAAALPALATADVTGPYTADADTLILYHLDEAPGSTLIANTAGPGTLDGVSTENQTPTSILDGSPGYPGFGQAGNNTLTTGIAVDVTGDGVFRFDDDSTVANRDIFDTTLLGETFTLEALVRPASLDPGGASPHQHLWGADGSSGRAFQFRINAGGVLNFDLIDSGNGGAVTFDLRSLTGAHAFAANEWFHVALSYDRGTTRFYWTRLDSGAEQANLVHTSTAALFDDSVDAPLVLANEGRSFGGTGEGLRGRIDEARVSTVARAADDFLFGPSSDRDGDGLPDWWETAHGLDPDDNGSDDFDQGADGDPDGDGFGNLVEFEAGSDPSRAASTPADTDADGLDDDFERAAFSTLDTGPQDDPDGDGEDTASELAQGSAPNNAASNSADIDADGLPDAWELEQLGDRATNGGDDPDGDGFGNLQEHLAGSDPATRGSRPPGTAVRLVPVDDGDPATSEFGFAGSSAINTVAFVRSSLQTFGDQQFVTWYGRHQADASHRFNNTIWIGRRTLGSADWEVFRHASFTANDINDGHDVICFGIDGDGYLHLSWGMHGDDFHYSRSTTPVTGNAPIELGPDTTMTGNENTVTYPQFLRLPDGDLLYLFREGASGAGDTYLNRYRLASGAWENVHLDAGAQAPFIRGRGWTPDYNPYPNMPQLGGPEGSELVLTWCWRYEPVGGDSPANENGYQTNNNFALARSPDGGLSWRRGDGSAYALPISRNGENGDPDTAAEHIVTIPEGSSLINQASMCLDAAGQPVIASWWAPGAVLSPADHRRQYMVVFRDDDGHWQTRAVSSRASDPVEVKYDESAVRDLGRPIVVTDDEDRIIVAYRDDEHANGLTIVHSLPRTEDPDRQVWIEFDLSDENLGNYEPIIDNELWDRERQLHFLHQPSAGKGYTPPANNASRVSVLEWDARAYFSSHPQPSVSFVNGGRDALITCPSQPSWSYHLWSSTGLDEWQRIASLPGTGDPLEFLHPDGGLDPQRFWRIEYEEGGTLPAP